MTLNSLTNKFIKCRLVNFNSPIAAHKFMCVGSEWTPVGRMKAGSRSPVTGVSHFKNLT